MPHPDAAPPMDAPAPGPGPGPGGPDEAMAAEEQRGQEAMATAASAAPKPDKPFTIKKLQGLSKELASVIGKLGGPDAPDFPVWEPPPEHKGDWMEPVPAPIFAPLFALQKVVNDLGFQQHDLKLGELTNDVMAARTQAGVKKIGSDKKLKKALEEGAPAPEQTAEAPPPRSQMEPMDGEDQELAA